MGYGFHEIDLDDLLFVLTWKKECINLNIHCSWHMSLVIFIYGTY